MKDYSKSSFAAKGYIKSTSPPGLAKKPIVVFVVLCCKLTTQFVITIESLQKSGDDTLTPEIEGLTEAEIAEIDALRILIEQIGFFLDNGPEGYVPTV